MMCQKFTIMLMLLFCFKLEQGDMCNNNCISCYQTSPHTNFDCNPQGRDVTLQCIVYAPHAMGTAMTTIKWFKSDADNDVEMQLIRGSSKYSFINSLSTVPEHTSRSGDTNITGLFQDIYTVSIRNFSISDNGYYWCQLESVTNSSCLIFPRSPQGYIIVDMMANRYCTHSDYLQQLQPLQCVLPQNICISFPDPSCTSTPSNTSLVGILGFLVAFLSVILLTTVIVFAVSWLRRKKRYERERKKNTVELSRAIARGDFEFTNAQLFQGYNNKSAEYEDPDYCIPEENVNKQEMKVSENFQSPEKPYERIDPGKLDYMSVYHAPNPRQEETKK